MTETLSDTLLIRRPNFLENKLSQSKSKNTKNDLVDGDIKMNPKLKIDEVLVLVKKKFIESWSEILKVLDTFDLEKSGIVTKGELRRVLDKYCMPLTTNQYENLLASIPMVLNKNGSVNYKTLSNFLLDKPNTQLNTTHDIPGTKLPLLERSNTTIGPSITGRNNLSYQRSQLSSSQSSRSSVSSSFSNTHRNWSYSMFTIDDLIPVIQKKVSQNPAALLKAIRLFDFNSDQTIQKFRFKKILENFCCSFNDAQFEKLLSKFSYSESGSVNYVEFLRNLGIPLDSSGNLGTSKNKNIKKSQSTDDDSLDVALTEVGKISLIDLEKLAHIFRKKVENKFEVLKKTFFVLDPTADGYVTIDQLHKVIVNFIFPMSQNVFRQLMEKFAFKATGKIAWLTFLKKFLDPQSKKLNGSTFPTKSELTCNPIQGVGNDTSVDELLELLFKHINNNYNSFRDAFMRINKNKEGRISRSEFLKILKRFQFNISPEQARTLFDYLDPNKYGFITYHHFLTLFEQKESLAAHPWLNSTHKVVDVKTDLPLTSDMLKYNLRQHCIEKWPELVQKLKEKDPTKSGFLTVKQLKRVLINLFDYLHSEDVDGLVSNLKLKSKDGNKEKVSYLELLNLLDVDAHPTDTSGLSTQITESSEQFAKDRSQEHSDKMNQISRNIHQHSANTSVDEVKVRIRDKLQQDRFSSFEIFKKFEHRDKIGGMDRRNLKKLLESFGYPLSNDQILQLCNEIHFPTTLNPQSRIDFNQFLVCFLDTNDELSSGSFDFFQPNHRYNDIRGANEKINDVTLLETWLRKHIANGYSSLQEAHKKLDTNGKGFITRKDIELIFQLHNITVDPDIYNELCNKLKITKKAKLNYKEFIDIFQLRDSLEEGHKWLKSQHRYNEINDVQELSAEEVAQLLKEKIEQYFEKGSTAFCFTVTSGKGYVTFTNFLELLSKLQLKMNKDEAKKLWKIYTKGAKSRLDYAAFISNLGLTHAFSSGDTGGHSANIINGSHNACVEHLAGQELRHQQSQDRQALIGSQMTVESLYEALKQHIRTSYQDNATAFKAINSGKTLTSCLNLQDLDKLLTQMHLFVSNETFVQLAARLGFQGPNDSLDYNHFCSIFKDKLNGPQDNQMSRQSSGYYSNKEGGVADRIVNVTEVRKSMPTLQLNQLIEQKITKQLPEITQTLSVLDTDKSGLISMQQLRNLLTSFCVQMTDEQFVSLLKSELISCCVGADKDILNQKKVPMSAIDKFTFDYQTYLKKFNQDQSTDDYIQIDKNAKLASHEMSAKQITQFIAESIQARPKLFLDLLRQKDYALIGVVSKSDVQSVLEQLIFKLTPIQFQQYWTENVTTNNFQNVDYVEFIKQISGYEEPTKNCEEINSKRPSTSDGVRLNTASSVNSKRSFDLGQVAEEEDPEESIHRNLERVLQKHWQSIYSRCRQHTGHLNSPGHIENNATISVVDFCKILNEFNSELSPEKIRSLNLYKTLQKSGNMIRYGDLIRSIVLSSRGSIVSQESALDVQKKFEAVGIKLNSLDGSKNYFPLLYKLRRQVLQNWKELRKQFLPNDSGQTGMVTGTIFMRTVTKVCGRLSPDLFYHLMTIYDTDGSGRFNYKKFIEDFLKTT